MNKRELTCIVCPRGCQMTVEMGDEITVSGNRCPRGKVYAQNECVNPQRTVTSTVRTSDGGVVAVKTEGTIPKAKMMECMENCVSRYENARCHGGRWEDVVSGDGRGSGRGNGQGNGNRGQGYHGGK